MSQVDPGCATSPSPIKLLATIELATIDDDVKFLKVFKFSIEIEVLYDTACGKLLMMCYHPLVQS